MTIRNWLYCWVAGASLYGWFISKLQVQQLAAAAIVSLSVTAALAAVASSAQLSFVVEWRWLVKLLCVLPRKTLRDIGLLLTALWRSFTTRNRFTGAFHTRQFDPGQADAASAARRALVFAAISLAPNTFAVASRGGDQLIVHQLVPDPGSRDKEWPV